MGKEKEEDQEGNGKGTNGTLSCAFSKPIKEVGRLALKRERFRSMVKYATSNRISSLERESEIENRSRKLCHRPDRMGIAKIRTFSFFSDFACDSGRL